MEEKVKEINQILNDNVVSRNLEGNIVFQNIKKFYELAQKLRIVLNDFDKNIQLEVNIDEVEKVSVLEMIEIIKKFYKEYNINLDLENLIQTGIISAKLTNTEEIDFDLCGEVSLENNIKVLDFNNNGLIIDVPILAHELGHIRNLGEKLTQENNLFTESLSRCDELLIVDYLEKNGYEQQMKNYKIHLLKTANKSINYKEVLFKILYLYKTLGDISKENYEFLFKETENYDQIINRVYDYLKKNSKPPLLQPASYLLDTYISCYLFLKYKENPEYLNVINEFNEIIKTESLETCLSFIGLKDLEIESQDILLDSVKEYINDITEEKIKTK